MRLDEPLLPAAREELSGIVDESVGGIVGSEIEHIPGKQIVAGKGQPVPGIDVQVSAGFSRSSREGLT